MLMSKPNDDKKNKQWKKGCKVDLMTIYTKILNKIAQLIHQYTKTL